MDNKDETVIDFLETQYDQINSMSFEFTKEEYVNLFYDDLKAFKDGEY